VKLIEQDDKIGLDVLFRHACLDVSPDEISLERMQHKGHYRLTVGKESFDLVDGRDPMGKGKYP